MLRLISTRESYESARKIYQEAKLSASRSRATSLLGAEDFSVSSMSQGPSWDDSFESGEKKGFKRSDKKVFPTSSSIDINFMQCDLSMKTSSFDFDELDPSSKVTEEGRIAREGTGSVSELEKMLPDEDYRGDSAPPAVASDSKSGACREYSYTLDLGVLSERCMAKELLSLYLQRWSQQQKKVYYLNSEISLVRSEIQNPGAASFTPLVLLCQEIISDLSLVSMGSIPPWLTQQDSTSGSVVWYHTTNPKTSSSLPDLSMPDSKREVPDKKAGMKERVSILAVTSSLNSPYFLPTKGMLQLVFNSKSLSAVSTSELPSREFMEGENRHKKLAESKLFAALLQLIAVAAAVPDGLSMTASSYATPAKSRADPSQEIFTSKIKSPTLSPPLRVIISLSIASGGSFFVPKSYIGVTASLLSTPLFKPIRRLMGIASSIIGLSQQEISYSISQSLLSDDSFTSASVEKKVVSKDVISSPTDAVTTIKESVLACPLRLPSAMSSLDGDDVKSDGASSSIVTTERQSIEIETASASIDSLDTFASSVKKDSRYSLIHPSVLSFLELFEVKTSSILLTMLETSSKSGAKKTKIVSPESCQFFSNRPCVESLCDRFKSADTIKLFSENISTGHYSIDMQDSNQVAVLNYLLSLSEGYMTAAKFLKNAYDEQMIAELSRGSSTSPEKKATVAESFSPATDSSSGVKLEKIEGVRYFDLSDTSQNGDYECFRNAYLVDGRRYSLYSMTDEEMLTASASDAASSIPSSSAASDISSSSFMRPIKITSAFKTGDYVESVYTIVEFDFVLPKCRVSSLMRHKSRRYSMLSDEEHRLLLKVLEALLQGAMIYCWSENAAASSAMSDIVSSGSSSSKRGSLSGLLGNLLSTSKDASSGTRPKEAHGTRTASSGSGSGSAVPATKAVKKIDPLAIRSANWNRDLYEQMIQRFSSSSHFLSYRFNNEREKWSDQCIVSALHVLREVSCKRQFTTFQISQVLLTFPEIARQECLSSLFSSLVEADRKYLWPQLIFLLPSCQQLSIFLRRVGCLNVIDPLYIDCFVQTPPMEDLKKRSGKDKDESVIDTFHPLYGFNYEFDLSIRDEKECALACLWLSYAESGGKCLTQQGYNSHPRFEVPASWITGLPKTGVLNFLYDRVPEVLDRYRLRTSRKFLCVDKYLDDLTKLTKSLSATVIDSDLA